MNIGVFTHTHQDELTTGLREVIDVPLLVEFSEVFHLFPQYAQTVQANAPGQDWVTIRAQVPGLAGMTAARLSPAQKRQLQDLFAARLERQWKQSKAGLPLRLLLRYAVLPWLLKLALEH